MNKEFKPQLKDGALGSKMVKYFKDYLPESPLPVNADCLGNVGEDEVCYRLTFEDDTVSDYKFVFKPGMSLDIVSAEEFNKVL